LQDNGGPTLTHTPLVGSLAIDAGDNSVLPTDTQDLDGDGDTEEPIPFDQRGDGFNRVVGDAVDIGAVEVGNNGFTVGSDLTSLILKVNWDNPTPNEVPVRVIDEEGNVIPEENFASNNITIVEELTDETSKAVVISDPDPGVWDIEVIDETGLGEVESFATEEATAEEDDSRISVDVDYRFDTNNFFDTQAKRDALEETLDDVASRLSDDLDPIIPGDGNTWEMSFLDPSTGESVVSLTDETIPADTLRIFVGARPLEKAGLAAFGSASASGSSDFINTVSSRGEISKNGDVISSDLDFGPWGGWIVFNSDIDWDFESNPPRNLIIHEFFHVLGFLSGNESFQRLIDDSNFTFIGPEATAEYDGSGNPPLNGENDLIHWGDITDDGQRPLMRSVVGTLTALDLAALKDIGWEVVEASENLPPTATADQGINFTTNEGIILNINAANGVLANDTDPEEEPLIVNAVEGEEDNVGTELELASGALLTLNADGSYSYDPNGAFEGLNEGETNTDSFSYTVSDGNGGTDTATVEITINGETDNQPPEFDQTALAVDENETLVPVTVNDPDGDEVTLSLAGGADQDSFTIDAEGNLVFTEAPEFENPADEDGNNVYEVQVTADDGNGGTTTENLQITVTNVNEAPLPEDDTNETNEGEVLTVDAANGVLANDTDLDEGDTLEVSAVEGDVANVGTEFELDSGALLTLNADGSYSYNPNGAFEELNEGETDTDSFSYTVSDGNGGTDTATVEITINGVTSDSFPVIPSDQTFTIEEDSAIDTAVGTVEATTPDDSELTFSLDENNLPTDVDGDGTLPFAINDQGQLTVADRDDLNVESPESFTFNVIVTNEQELTDTEAVTVNLETTGQEPSPITTLDDLVFGTPNNDSLNAADQDNPYTGDNQITFTGAGEDTVDGLTG
jgi:VCBS repeat-containing protein